MLLLDRGPVASCTSLSKICLREVDLFCGTGLCSSERASLASNVSLTPERGQFVQSRVASGWYQTASEVVREGLRLLEEREQARETALEELRAKIRRGSDQADCGELLDGDAVFEEIRQLSARRRALSK